MYHSAIAGPGVKVRSGQDIPWAFSGLRKGRLAEVYLPGCNLKCEFCVAPYLINLGEIRGIQWIEATDLVRAVAGSVDVLGFSGGEPTIHVDYLTDAFSECRKRGIHTIIETNGYMTGRTAEKIAQYTDYVGIGLKASLDPTFYERRLGAKTEPILEAIAIFAKYGCEMILTNLTDPNLWGDTEAFEELTAWISSNLGPSTRLVLASMEKAELLPPYTDERVYVAPLEQREAYVRKYQKIAKDAGLSQVFVQDNVRRKSEERREHLEKIGLFRALERLGVSSSQLDQW
jgi:pyruvate formate lyase activating enzyme